MTALFGVTLISDRWYFGALRGAGSNTLFRIVFVLSCLGMGWCLWRVVTQPLGQVVATCIFGAILVLVIAAWGWLRMASYRDTDMMLRPDGRGTWSIHMGTLASMLPFYYMFIREGFIPRGEVAIIEAARRAGLRGTIEMESHLYADPDKRQRRINDLTKALGAGVTVAGTASEKKLGWLYAIWLSILRDCLYLRRNAATLMGCSTRPYYPAKKFCFLRGGNPLGVITVTLP